MESYNIVFLWLVYFTEHHFLKLSSCCSIMQDSLFKVWITVHCMSILHFSLPIHLLMDIWDFPHLGYCEWCCIEHGDVNIFSSFDFSCFRWIARSGIAGSYVVIFLAFWGTSYSLGVAPFYIPINSAQGFQFLHNLAKTCYFGGQFW